MKRVFGKLFEDSLQVDTGYRIGMRVVKTIAAVAICLLIAWLMGSRDSLPIAAIAAIVTMQATGTETVKIGVFRVLGTIIGGIFGILAVLIGLSMPEYAQGLFIVVIPIMLLFNFYICNLLNMKDACSISCVVTIIVGSQILVEASFGESLAFTFIRVRDTLIGVSIATIINMLPKLAHKIRKH
ncbi:MAG: aromatic acid exporter family protein [Oscillospiraceae bacterium]|nr:aromatic acid exporter family protein [Oscillospiraceae bacterium]MCL2279190.1 aromatic acid exporter family protein [Oscillospiraceae bacterium]